RVIGARRRPAALQYLARCCFRRRVVPPRQGRVTLLQRDLGSSPDRRTRRGGGWRGGRHVAEACRRGVGGSGRWGSGGRRAARRSSAALLQLEVQVAELL